MKDERIIKDKVLELAKLVDREFLSKTPIVSVMDLKQDLIDKKSLIIVDVREPEEQSTSMIKGAISLEKFAAQKDELKDKKIVMYCTIGHRSAIVSEKYRSLGFNTHSLSGSILMWVHEKGELIDQNNNPTNIVHVYEDKWDLLPKGYLGVK